MLGLIYIFATAKPISMRRLSVLFVLVLISARLVLRVLHVRTPGGALLTATLVTLFVWSTPLWHIMHATVSRRALSLDTLQQVSGFVRWTYGFVAAMLIVVVSAIMNPTQSLHLALPRLLVIAAIVAFVSTMFIPGLLLQQSRGRAASGPYMARRTTCRHAASVAPVSRSGRCPGPQARMRVDEPHGAFFENAQLYANRPSRELLARTSMPVRGENPNQAGVGPANHSIP